MTPPRLSDRQRLDTALAATSLVIRLFDQQVLGPQPLPGRPGYTRPALVTLRGELETAWHTGTPATLTLDLYGDLLLSLQLVTDLRGHQLVQVDSALPEVQEALTVARVEAALADTKAIFDQQHPPAPAPLPT